MTAQHALLLQLADGRFHSGVALGAALGVGRGAIWKQIQSCAARGVQIHAVRGRGYRLAQPLELLDAQTLLAALPVVTRDRVQRLEVHGEIDSTNRHLLRIAAAEPAASGVVCLAERQTAGRGRRGRAWVSPFGANIYLSLLWRFANTPESGLSLAVAVAVARALHAAGLAEPGLKWPNDIWHHDRKLAGVLLEMSGEAQGPTVLVAGIGLNVSMPRVDAAAIDQPWTDLVTALGRPMARNPLAASLIHHVMQALQEYSRTGLASFMSDWDRWDITRDRPLTVHLEDQPLHGIGRGIAADGALRVEHADGMRRYSCGEVSLRPTSCP